MIVDPTKALWLCVGLFFALGSCKQSPTPMQDPSLRLSESELYDKVLGALLGSAIGDAMGAPTEMWSRERIQAEFGHVEGLTPLVREPSPEGTWEYNLPAGGSTDDTRWKAVMVDVLTQTSTRPVQLSAHALADALTERYIAEIKALQALPEAKANSLEAGMQGILWLKEWISVAEAYQSGDVDRYGKALNQFYGGEMVCGGMLFSPLIGVAYPGAPTWAYEQASALNIYDIGYARDIGALTAAMAAAAMRPGSQGADLQAVLREVDPSGYFRSRLVGRSAYDLYRRSLDIVHQARQQDPLQALSSLPVSLAMPVENPSQRLRYLQWSHAYASLDQQLFRMPFHPGELWLVSWTAMLLCDFDFRQSLAFIVNYGRDNDTSAAIVGAILGAMYGAQALPADLKEPALRANLALGMDLEEMAKRLSAAIPHQPGP
ncbi:MAG: ADP-ribosylglycohydrolase family protein [Bacteroidota bacterium]